MPDDLDQRLVDALRAAGTVVGQLESRTPEQFVDDLNLDIDADRVEERLYAMRFQERGVAKGAGLRFRAWPVDEAAVERLRQPGRALTNTPARKLLIVG
jgi:hypothetical protein